MVDVTDAVRNAIAEFIKPSKSRYYLSFMKFIRKYKGKKKPILKPVNPSNVIVNVNKGHSNKYKFQEQTNQFQEEEESDLE
jgi:hypothetical protein